MPQPRMDIRMIKDILRLKHSGEFSHEAIARSLSISKGVVAKYLSLAGAARRGRAGLAGDSRTRRGRAGAPAAWAQRRPNPRGRGRLRPSALVNTTY